MITLGIWWSNEVWIIGSDSSKGQSLGFALYTSEDYCPHQLKENIWSVSNNKGHLIHDPKLSITCK